MRERENERARENERVREIEIKKVERKGKRETRIGS